LCRADAAAADPRHLLVTRGEQHRMGFQKRLVSTSA
jgi:hypothetical protein